MLIQCHSIQPRSRASSESTASNVHCQVLASLSLHCGNPVQTRMACGQSVTTTTTASKRCLLYSITPATAAWLAVLCAAAMSRLARSLLSTSEPFNKRNIAEQLLLRRRSFITARADSKQCSTRLPSSREAAKLHIKRNSLSHDKRKPSVGFCSGIFSAVQKQ